MKHRGFVARMSPATTLVLLLIAGGQAFAQGATHPGCPLCPGGGYSVQALERAGAAGPGRATLSEGRLFNTFLIAPGSMSELQNSLRWGATERLELGLTYLANERRFLPQINYSLVPEQARRPGFSVGAGIDRPGGEENAFYLVAGKALDREMGRGWSAYLGGSYRREESKLLPVCGAAKVLSPRWAATLQYDGSDAHLGLQTRIRGVNVSLLWLRLENIGAAIGISVK